MTVSTRAPRRTAEQWQALVDQQIQSGLSGAAFCQSEGIKYQSFMNWRTRLSDSHEMTPKETQFVELTAAPQPEEDSKTDWLIELDLAPGIQLRIAR